MTSIRLPNKIENNLDNIARNEHKTKSEIIKLAVKKFIYEYYNKVSPYELGKESFGKYGSMINDNSINYKKKIKDKISDKFIN